MRLDKFISNNSKYSRSDIDGLIKRKKIQINNQLVESKSISVSDLDIVTVHGEHIQDLGMIYYVLDKPKGYVSATEDKEHKVITELVPEKYKHLNLKPVGRLDKDTTGLIILTNDNDFIHKMTSPKNEIEKVYLVELADPIEEHYQEEFNNGIKLKDGYTTKRAQFVKLESNKCEVTLIEGKYHQVKRMFGALGNKVTELRRIKFGDYQIKR